MPNWDAYPGWPKGQIFKIVSRAPAMVALFKRAIAVAKSGKPALIIGPPGCGKYLFARAIHADGAYREGAFIQESCGSRTPEHLRLDLFAEALKPDPKRAHNADDSARHRSAPKPPETCRYYEARRGTLYLTLAHQLDVHTQNRIADVLTETFRFSKQPMPAGVVRLTLSSHFDALALKRRFTRRLWDLLEDQVLELPRLSERLGDIPELAKYFVTQYATRAGLTAKPIESAALEALQRHEWPGNVRELERLTQHALTRAKGPEITRNDFLAGVANVEVGSAAGGQSLSAYYEDLPEPAQGSRPPKPGVPDRPRSGGNWRKG